MPGAKNASEKPARNGQGAPPVAPPVRAFRSPAAIAAFAAVALAAIAADLWSKHAVFADLLGAPDVRPRAERLLAHHGPDASTDDLLRALRLHRPVFAGFRLTLSTNPGVVFGLPMPPWVVAIATVLTMGLVCYFFASSEAGARWLHVALAMILSGAVGNFYDRTIARVAVPGAASPITGQVRDFLDFSDWGYAYIFNVADVFLVVGVAMLMIHWWAAALREHREKRSAKQNR